jgi:autotransporter-associated beta strand protein
MDMNKSTQQMVGGAKHSRCSKVWTLLKSSVLIAGSALIATSTQAGVFTWNGVASKNWTGANWNEGTPNNDGTDDIHMAGNFRLSNRANGGWDINSLTFDSGAGAFVVSGFSADEILLEAGGIINNSTTLQTVNHPLLLNANQTWHAAAGGLSLGGAVNLFNFTLTLDGAKDTTVGGAVSGNGSVVKTGAGALTLSGNNSFAGGISVNAGTLVAGSDTAFGGGTVTINGGAQLQSAGGNRVFANNITLNGGDIVGNDQNQRFGSSLVTSDSSITLTPDSVHATTEFASLNVASGATLQVFGWSGVELADGRVLSLDDKLLVVSDPGDAVLSLIDFVGFTSGARWNPVTYELTPVPEPTLAALVGVGLVVCALSRRLKH